MVIFNNARYGALQEFAPVFGFTDPVQGTDLPGIHFVALAQGMGCQGVCITEADKLRDALRDALRSPTPTLVEIQVA